MLENLTRILIETSEALTFKTSEGSLVTDAVEAALSAAEAKGYVSKRFSPSGYVCARWKAHQRLNDFEPIQTPNPVETLRLFKAGTGAHEVLQQQVLSLTDNFYGKWVCASCGVVVNNSMKPRQVCNGTRQALDILGNPERVEECTDVLRREDVKWIYKERYVYSNPLDNDKYAIAGFVDGIWVKDGKWYVLEVKSAASMMFNAQYRTKHPELENHFVLKPTQSRYPLGNHVAQGMVYAKMLIDEAESGDLPLDPDAFGGVILLYVNRETFDLKEYHIEYSPASYAELQRLAEATMSAVEAGNAMLAPPKCTSANNMLAKRCPLKDTCFPKKPRKAKKKKDD